MLSNQSCGERERERGRARGKSEYCRWRRDGGEENVSVCGGMVEGVDGEGEGDLGVM